MTKTPRRKPAAPPVVEPLPEPPADKVHPAWRYAAWVAVVALAVFLICSVLSTH